MASEYIRGRRQAMALVAAGLLALSTSVLAQDEGEEAAQGDSASADLWQLPEPDTSKWRCRLCPFPSGWDGYADVGVGDVSDDSYRFGDYRGLEEKGTYGIAGGELRYRGEEGGYLDVTGSELGLDTRSVRAEGGTQGSYRLWLEYDELPHFIADDTRTVFSGAGTDTLTLPGGWTRADDTGGMTALGGSLQDVTIDRERKSGALGLDVLQGDHWKYSVEARKHTQEGNRVQGGSFLFRSALLPAPVDYETDQVNASVRYMRDRWQVEAAYYASMFTNENRALVWDNPFTSSNNADRGRLALAPDNQFNQVMLSGSWRSTDALTVAGRVAVGRMEQNEDYLAPTINSSLSAPQPPRNDLDGQVDTRTANLRIVGDATDRITAKGEIYYDERDNQSPRDSYVQVATDERVTGARTNRPYSYKKRGADVTLDYHAASDLRFSAGGGRENMDRTYQEVETTRTDTVWAEVKGSPTDRTTLRLRKTREMRDGAYDSIGLMPPENPDLRKFHIAERQRDLTLLSLDYLATDTVTVGVTVDWADDEYTDSDIGLTDARDTTYSFNVSAVPTDGLTAYGFVSMQSINSTIRGADNVTGAPWTASELDDYRTVGVGFEVAELPWGFTEGRLDLTHAAGTTKVDIDKGIAAPPIPNVDTRLYTLSLSAARPLGKDTDLRLGYLLEGFTEDDYHRDGVDPGTIPTVLTLGEGTAGYTVHVIQLALRYRF